MEALIGTALGGVFRMLPELLKWFDRKDDRKHEVEMFNLQIKADELKGQQAIIEADAKLGASELQAMIEATRAQSIPTGVKWVDAVNSLMRPLITFWWVIVLYTISLACGFISMLHGGLSGIDAIVLLWGADEKAIVASIISFWFVDRSLRKGFGK